MGTSKQKTYLTFIGWLSVASPRTELQPVANVHSVQFVFFSLCLFRYYSHLCLLDMSLFVAKYVFILVSPVFICGSICISVLCPSFPLVFLAVVFSITGNNFLRLEEVQDISKTAIKEYEATGKKLCSLTYSGSKYDANYSSKDNNNRTRYRSNYEHSYKAGTEER